MDSITKHLARQISAHSLQHGKHPVWGAQVPAQTTMVPKGVLLRTQATPCQSVQHNAAYAAKSGFDYSRSIQRSWFKFGLSSTKIVTLMTYTLSDILSVLTV